MSNTLCDPLPVWLIERGQAEHQQPTVWWIAGPSLKSREGERWTEHAHEATAFASRDAAMAVEYALFMHPTRGLSVAVTEHLFLGRVDD